MQQALLPYPAFRLEQLAEITGWSAASTVDLQAHLATDHEDFEEIAEIYRPRDPTRTLWQLHATNGGTVMLTDLRSGTQGELDTVGDALALVVAVELEGLEPPA